MNKADNLARLIGNDKINDHFGIGSETDLAGLTDPVEIDGILKRVKNVAQIPLDRLVPDPDQPRRHFDETSLRELSESLKAEGQLQPIRVIKHPTESGNYIVLMGERRYRAAKLAGLATLDAVIEKKRLTEYETLLVQWTENAHRCDLNPIEQAETFQKLLAARGGSARDLARYLHVDVSSISRAIKLLDLSADIRSLIQKGQLPANVAYQLSKVSDEAQRREILDSYLKGEVNRDDIAKAVTANGGKKGKGNQQTKTKKANIDGITISVSAKKAVTNLEMAKAMHEFANRLESDGRSKRTAA